MHASGIFYYMNIWAILYETIVEALFPLSKIEKELFSYPLEEINAMLEPAPPYTGLAVLLPEAQSLFAYKDKRVEQLIWNIKYKKSTQAVEIGGYVLFQRLQQSVQSYDLKNTHFPETFMPYLFSRPSILIVPMPITVQRRRERGYNQCELLTHEIHRLYKTMQKNELLFENNLLIRTHHDSRHTLKGRADRVKSAKGIFEINKQTLEKLATTYDAGDTDAIKKCAVIIVDDVITTGSTMREAIDTVKKSGFTHVSGLSLAH